MIKDWKERLRGGVFVQKGVQKGDNSRDFLDVVKKAKKKKNK